MLSSLVMVFAAGLSGLASAYHVNITKRHVPVYGPPLPAATDQEMTTTGQTLWNQMFADPARNDQYTQDLQSIVPSFTSNADVIAAGWTASVQNSPTGIQPVINRLGQACIDNAWPGAGPSGTVWMPFAIRQDRPYTSAGGQQKSPTGASFEGILILGRTSTGPVTETGGQTKLAIYRHRRYHHQI